MSTRYRRFDRVETLNPPTRLDNGFLRAEGRIARVGIQEYRDGTGKVFRELRLPEEVFDAESLASFALMPVTNTHPPVMLTAENARQYAVGALGTPIRDGEYVRAEMVVHDRQAIADAEKGRDQLSNGYTCEIDDTQDPKLADRWGKYDGIQRKIRGNHCALVDAARAGPEARLRLDAGDAEAVAPAKFGATPAPVLPSKTEDANPTRTKPMPYSLNIDSMTFEVADANIQAAVDRAIAEAKKQGDLVAVTEKTRADAAEKARELLRSELSALQAKSDALEAKVKADDATMIKCDECDGSGKCDECDGSGKCDGCGGKGEYPKKMDTAEHRREMLKRLVAKGVESRAKLVVDARRVLGANEKLDGLDELAIKKLVLAKLDKDLKLDGKDATYISHRFDFEMETFSKKHGGRQIDNVLPSLRGDGGAGDGGKGGGRSDAPPADGDEAYLRQNAKVLELNRKK